MLNKLVVGKMKDEIGGVIINGYFALKPKIYWFLVHNSSELKKAKGSINTKIIF